MSEQARRNLQRLDRGDFAAVRLRGECEELEEDFHLRFPSLRRGLRSFTSLYSHTHRRWGSIDSRGTTADRARRGGRPYTILGVNRGSTSTGTGYPAQKMRWFRFPRPVRSRTTPCLATSMA